MFLLNNNWFDDDNYAMLSGNIDDTSGNIVKGIQNGLWNNCTITDENDCKKIIKTDTTIGKWTFNPSTGISINLPNESEVLSIIENDESPTGYYIQSHGYDKVGSIWHEKLFSGTDATEDLVQSLMN